MFSTPKYGFKANTRNAEEQAMPVYSYQRLNQPVNDEILNSLRQQKEVLPEPTKP